MRARIHRQAERLPYKLRRWAALLALWMLGAPFTVGQNTAPLVTATVELKNGEKREGTAVFKDGSLFLAPDGGDPVRVALADLARMNVSVRAAGPANESAAPPGALPAPWRSKDLGRVAIPGKARWKDGQFLVSSAPRAGDERFDAFHLVYMPIKGDGEIIARVVKLDDHGEDTYAGIVMCDGLTPENRKAVLGVHPFGEKGVNFRRWGYQGGSSTGRGIPSLQLPYWVKLVREGYDVKAYHSPDGRRWRFLKVSEGKMRDENIYVGLAVRLQNSDRLGETIIDRVSVNGKGSRPGEPMLPSVVLRSGSRIASHLARADGTAFHLSGRWKDVAVTAPQVARVEFFHPLPDDLQNLVRGDRAGLLLRSGDFSEGSFEAIADGKVKVGSVLFGSKEHSILDEADALVLREVVEGPAAWVLDTRAGSVLRAQSAKVAGGKLVVEVEGLGEARFALDEVKSVRAK